MERIYSKISATDKCTFDTNYINHIYYHNLRKAVFINKLGVQCLCLLTRRPLPHDFLDHFNIEVLNKKWLTVETDYIGKIIQIFGKHHSHKSQYIVNSKYRIDLYFLDLRIAIECDEYGHQSYNKEI